MTFFGLALVVAACTADAIPTSVAGPPQNRLVAKVEVRPSSVVFGPDQTIKLEATVKGARGQVVNRPVSWSSSDESVVRVDGAGNLVAVNEGTATIRATVQGVVGKANVDVRGKVRDILVVAPSLLGEGRTQRLSVTYVFDNGAKRPAGAVRWASSDRTVVQIGADGLVRASGPGDASVLVQARGQSGGVGLKVGHGEGATLTLNTDAVTLEPGKSVKLWAEITDSEGNRLSRKVQWSTSDATVARVDKEGLVTGVAGGEAIITAKSGSLSDSAVVTVVSGSSGGESSSSVAMPGKVTDLRVASVSYDAVSLRFTEVDDGTGSPADYVVRYMVSPIAWSDALDVTKGSCTSPVQGSSIGSARTCTVEGLQDATRYDFQLVAFRGTLGKDAVFGQLSNVASGVTEDAPIVVDVVPSAFEVEVGQNQQLEAAVTDIYGEPVDGTVAWSSSRSSVASVDSKGKVTGESAGDATITASAEGASDKSAATVTSDSGSPTSESGGGGSVASLTPNEPSGFTKLSERPFDAMGEDGWGVHSKNIYGSIEQDAAAPISPVNVYQMFYPAGTTGGGGDVNRIGYRIDGQGSFQEIYFTFPLKHSKNWQGHSSGVNKILYVRAAGYPASPFYVDAHGGQTGSTLSPEIRFQGQNNSVCGYNKTLNATQNRNLDKKFLKGEWHLVEVYAKLNTEGRCDGVVRMWLDGKLVVEYDDVVMLNPGESPWEWTGINVDPIWGGTGDTVQQDMWKRMDHFYISAR